jgi:hypothetical protein
MKKVVRLTESDLQRIVSKVINEESMTNQERKKRAMKYLRKISEHLKDYNVDKSEFASSDMNYFIDMFEKIANNQEIKL